MEDARIRAFSRSLGSNFRTFSLPLLIGAIMYAWAGTGHATPECQNLGAGDPMTDTGDVVTGGNDTCTITSASPLANNVDALGQAASSGADILKLDGTGTSFSFDVSKIGTEFTNFETVQIESTLTGTPTDVTLTGTNSATVSWLNHGFVRGTATLVGAFTNDGGTIAPGFADGNIGSMTITGAYTTGTSPGNFKMDVNLTSGAADYIHITGAIAGATYVAVNPTNLPNAGVATTGDGILLVHGDGATAGAWALKNAVVSGAYQYTLNSVVTSATDNDLYLQSHLREEFYGNDALLASGQAMIRSCFRSDQRIPDSPRQRDDVRMWASAGGASFKTGEDTGVAFDDQMYCANGGLDVGIGEGMRFGVIGGYGSSNVDVTTPGGIGKLDGNTEALEVLLSVGTPLYFLNVTGGYATTAWTFDGPVQAPKDATQSGFIASAQAGATVNVTPFRFKFIGEVNYDKTSCGSDCLLVGMTEDTGNIEAKGTIRIEAMTHQINPYVAVSFADDLTNGTTVSYASESLRTDAGHSLLSLNAGFNAPIDSGVLLFGDFSVIDGMGNSTSGYTAAGGFKAYW